MLLVHIYLVQQHLELIFRFWVLMHHVSNQMYILAHVWILVFLSPYIKVLDSRYRELQPFEAQCQSLVRRHEAYDCCLPVLGHLKTVHSHRNRIWVLIGARVQPSWKHIWQTITVTFLALSYIFLHLCTWFGPRTDRLDLGSPLLCFQAQWVRQEKPSLGPRAYPIRNRSLEPFFRLTVAICRKRYELVCCQVVLLTSWVL